jgi:GxxExxY protein
MDTDEHGWNQCGYARFAEVGGNGGWHHMAHDLNDRHGMKDEALTESILCCAIKVSNGLGAGFLEKVYENALTHELRKSGLRVHQQRAIEVVYDGVVVGDYAADILVEDRVLVELKAVRTLDPVHEAQLLNYLKATGLEVGLLLNFGTPRLGIKRMILSTAPRSFQS